MSREKVIPIARPFVGTAELENLKQVLDSGWLTEGRFVQAFEEAFRIRHRVEYAIAVTSATSGLHLSLVALGIGPGDEVIVPSFTWVATANVVEHVGARPVFCDVSLDTYNLTVESVLSLVTPRTRAIIAVHLFGRPAPVEDLKATVGDEVRIIEDAACATGASGASRPVGGLGDMGVFSFHPRKSVTTGEGGMITTDSHELADMLRRLRNHGATAVPAGSGPSVMPDFRVAGFNTRMTDLQAAVGVAQFARITDLLAERAGIAKYYRAKLADVPWLAFPVDLKDGTHGHQSFVIRVKPELAPATRNEIIESLASLGVMTRPGTHAVHELAFYRDKYGIEAADLPNALACSNTTIALPMFNGMTEEDLSRVIGEIRSL